MLRDRAPPAAAVSRVLRTRGLDEARVWDELATGLNLRRALRPNVENIVHYAFTEMLNNVIEHSEADRCSVRFRLEPGMLSFVLRFHRIQVEWSRVKKDVFVSNPRFLNGTGVSFAIQRSSRRFIEEIFSEFAPEEYDFRFQKTKMLVKLLQREFVSRSEAKRLVANLEKFSEIVLDFRDVKSVGQGFADEVFRVFARRHPAVKIATENTNPGVDAMIRHVRSQ
ncbi:MAG: STAS-like domain-containing protein [Pseudomonadota bacterium]